MLNTAPATRCYFEIDARRFQINIMNLATVSRAFFSYVSAEFNKCCIDIITVAREHGRNNPLSNTGYMSWYEECSALQRKEGEEFADYMQRRRRYWQLKWSRLTVIKMKKELKNIKDVVAKTEITRQKSSA